METAFTFDEMSHIYRIDRRIIPGVTRVLDHSGCVDFSFIQEDILERASERGKRVHAATHYYDIGDLDMDSLCEEERGYLESWIEWRRISGFLPSYCEHQMVASIDGHEFGMKVDRVGILGSKGRSAVIDIKTGPVGKWVKWQTAAYAAGFEDPVSGLSSPLARFLRRDRAAVQLFADGSTGKLHPFDDRQDYYAFSAMLYVTHLKIANGLTKGGL